jgi:predicted nuclease of predicted toxin-antitoxin system
LKLLFDQNLSPQLVDALSALFPGSRHVRQEGLDRADDDRVWCFARDAGFAIVTKDSDFQERSQIAGSKPHVIWIRRGNCSTAQVEHLLRANAARIGELDQQVDAGFLVLL